MIFLLLLMLFVPSVYLDRLKKKRNETGQDFGRGCARVYLCQLPLCAALAAACWSGAGKMCRSQVIRRKSKRFWDLRSPRSILQILPLWQEAAYSTHEMTGAAAYANARVFCRLLCRLSGRSSPKAAALDNVLACTVKERGILMKRIFLIFLCLTLLGTLCACRVRLIADPAQADTILQAQQEAQPPQEEEPQPPAQEEPEPPEQESEEASCGADPPDTPPQPDETAQAEQPDTSVSVAQTGTAVYTEQLAAGVTVTYDPNGGDSATVSASVTPGQPLRRAAGGRPARICICRLVDAAGRRRADFAGNNRFRCAGAYALCALAAQRRRDADPRPERRQDQVKEATLALSDGDCYGTLPIPLREGYDFNGWWTQIEGGEQILPETVFSGTDDRTVYAHWTW